MSFISESNKKILKLAAPAIAGVSTQMVVSIVDTAMVGRLENAEFTLAAMGLGVLATWTLIAFFSSFSTGTHILIAKNFGARNYEQCAKILFSSILFTFALGIFISGLGITFSSDIAHFFAADEKVGNLASEYFFYRFIGIPFFLITVSYRGFYFGIGKTRVFMYSGILTNLLNIIFNYIFIFGNFGAPKLGLAGAGLGSTLATIFDNLFYFSISILPFYKKNFGYLNTRNFNLNIIKSLVKLSLPVSFQNIFIMLGFLSFISITGLIGTVEQAASQTVVSILFISFMPCMGFGIAAQTLVGNSLGMKNLDAAKMLGLKTAKLATYFTIFVGIIFIIFPGEMLSIVTNDGTIIQTGIPLLRIAGFAQIFYAVGIVLANGLQAAGKTFYVMISEIISNIGIFVPLAYFLGVYFNFGIEGAWFALPFYVIFYSAMIFVKFKFGKLE